MTRFELGRQFVELALNGAEVHHRWGALGVDVRERVQTFADETAASHAWDRQLRRLEHRGYLPGRRNLELEALIRQTPDDAAPYRVYADWLLEQNDARGELIATMLNHGPHEALIEKHAVQFVPRMKSWSNFAWSNGFIVSAVVDLPTVNKVARVLRHPSSIVLKVLDLWKFDVFWREPTSAWNAVAPLLPSSLERIEVDSFATLWRERDVLAPELRSLLSLEVR